MIDLRERVAEFTALGYDAIPLRPGSKAALCAGWPRVAPAAQWADAPGDCNVGLRGGGDVGALFVDADDRVSPGTFGNVRRYLAGLGYFPDGDYPTVRTASGLPGHVYARASARLAGDFRELRRDLGAGELRYGPGAYVVAPGSSVSGRLYELVAGDLRQLPALDLADLRQLADVEPATSGNVRAVPRVPRLAARILAGDAATIARYPTRSESEQAAVASLIGAGFDFAAILALFVAHPGAGKFAELRRESEANALRWLRRSYDTARRWADSHESPGRALARQAQTWALSVPWPGRTGSSDRAVFLAHTELARHAGRLTYQASVRDLAELAGVSHPTAIKANRRLLGAGAVCCDKGHIGRLATVYALGAKMQTFTTHTRVGCEGVVKVCASSDAFRYRGLGKAAAEVLAQLEAQPGMSALELAAATGRHVTTIRRALGKLARQIDPESGEVLRLVEPDGDGWRALPVDLAAVARAVGTDGAGERQRAQHQRERAGFRRAVARARAATTPEPEAP